MATRVWTFDAKCILEFVQAKSRAREASAALQCALHPSSSLLDPVLIERKNSPTESHHSAPSDPCPINSLHLWPSALSPRLTASLLDVLHLILPQRDSEFKHFLS